MQANMNISQCHQIGTQDKATKQEHKTYHQMGKLGNTTEQEKKGNVNKLEHKAIRPNMKTGQCHRIRTKGNATKQEHRDMQQPNRNKGKCNRIRSLSNVQEQEQWAMLLRKNNSNLAMHETEAMSNTITHIAQQCHRQIHYAVRLGEIESNAKDTSSEEYNKEKQSQCHQMATLSSATKRTWRSWSLKDAVSSTNHITETLSIVTK